MPATATFKVKALLQDVQKIICIHYFIALSSMLIKYPPQLQATTVKSVRSVTPRTPILRGTEHGIWMGGKSRDPAMMPADYGMTFTPLLQRRSAIRNGKNCFKITQFTTYLCYDLCQAAPLSSANHPAFFVLEWQADRSVT